MRCKGVPYKNKDKRLKVYKKWVKKNPEMMILKYARANARKKLKKENEMEKNRKEIRDNPMLYKDYYTEEEYYDIEE